MTIVNNVITLIKILNSYEFISYLLENDQATLKISSPNSYEWLEYK